MKRSVTASAPGSLMLLGEHAVLHGKKALACAVNRHIRVRLTLREDREVAVRSALGHAAFSLDRLEPRPPFQFALAAVARRKDQLSHGFDLAIESDFSHEVGLGSSASVTVAVSAALSALLGEPLNPQRVFEDSLHVVREVQGLGSGADVAASTFGGVVAYRATPTEIQKLDGTHPLTVVYSGSKRSTVEVVRLVDEARAAQPELFNAIFNLMGASAEKAAEAIRQKDWKTVGSLLNINQGLMEALGVGSGPLAEIVYALRADPAVLGAKISGSGLGDCAIGLGKAGRRDWPYTVIEADMAEGGVRVE